MHDYHYVWLSFAIGGIGAVLYNIILRRSLVAVQEPEQHHERHRFH